MTPYSVWGQVLRENRWAGSVLQSRSFVHASRHNGHLGNVTARAWIVNTQLPLAQQTRINQATGTRAGWIEVRNIWTDDFFNIMDARGNWE